MKISRPAISAVLLLACLGHRVRYVVDDGEGRRFLRMENRVDFYTRMEKFRARHIGN